jgi:hypothetical protein
VNAIFVQPLSLTLVALAGTEQLMDLRETMMKQHEEYRFLFEKGDDDHQ